MNKIELRYGSESLSLGFEPGSMEPIGTPASLQPLSDAELGYRLDNPVGSAPLEEIAQPGESVLVVVD
jgi:hypothetical protein